MKKAWLPVLLMIISLAGLLWSRAVLSLSALLWVIWILAHSRKDIFEKENKSLLIWGISPICIALLGCWQNGFAKENLDHLLTLSTYMLAAFAGTLISAKYDHKEILKYWIWASLIALSFPLIWYATHYQEAVVRYGSGQTVPVWMDDDHVRFGVFLSISCFISLVFFPAKKMRLISSILLLAILILAIRTAWVMILVMLLITGLFILINGTLLQKRKLVSAIVAMVILAATIYFVFPGVQQKIAYTLYDWQQFQTGIIDPNLSDATRRVINSEAWKLIEAGQNNIGWSAIDDVIRKSIQTSYPQQKFDFGWPFNQWLFWWMGSGIAGLLLFSVWLIYPMIHGIRKKNMPLCAVSAAIIVSCLVETNLAYQYSVWIHAWVVALLWNNPSSFFQKSIISKSDSYENQKV
jgi:predicted membrane protein